MRSLLVLPLPLAMALVTGASACGDNPPAGAAAENRLPDASADAHETGAPADASGDADARADAGGDSDARADAGPPAIAIAVVLDPAAERALDFDDVPLGYAGSQMVAITNAGGNPLALGPIATVDPLASPFTKETDTCSSARLVAGASCFVVVRFAPTTLGVASDVFDVPSNDPAAPSVTIAARGSGVASLPEPAARPPRTGQTTCASETGVVIPCAGTGQDGETQHGVPWPSPRWIAGTGAEAACVVDTLTGLMWPRDAGLSTPVDWAGALAWVRSFNGAGGVCGHADWRLPNRNEMRSLANEGLSAADWRVDPAHGFVNVAGPYWTSTTRSDAPDRAWVAAFGSSITYTTTKSGGSGLRAWPVRLAGSGRDAGADAGIAAAAPVARTGQTTCWSAVGASIPCAGTGQDGESQAGVPWRRSRFLVAADTTLVDTLTGLAWAPRTDAQAVPGPPACTAGARRWDAALAFVACLDANAYLGHADWRLPNVNELTTLAHSGDDRALYLPAQGFPESSTSVLFWTSTTTKSAIDSLLDAYAGTARAPSISVKSETLLPWAVRGGP